MKVFSSVRSHLALWRKQLMLFVVAAVLVSTATAAEAPEIKRRYNNSVRLRLMHPYMQPKIGAILADLEHAGEKPTIHPAVYRSAATQAQLKGAGFSKVGYSFHMVTDRDTSGHNVPASMAADIIDGYRGYDVAPSFWLHLASSALSHDLTTGIFWGLAPKDRQKIVALIRAKNWNGKFRPGWDQAHTEPRPAVLTLHQARIGKRPPIPRSYNPNAALTPVNPKNVSSSGRLLEQKH